MASSVAELVKEINPVTNLMYVKMLNLFFLQDFVPPKRPFQ